VLQCVAVCCSVLTATISIKFSRESPIFVLQCVAVCCSVLQCVAVCCSVLQCVDCHNVNQVVTGIPDLYVAVCCSVLQCVAVC